MLLDEVLVSSILTSGRPLSLFLLVLSFFSPAALLPPCSRRSIAAATLLRLLLLWELVTLLPTGESIERFGQVRAESLSKRRNTPWLIILLLCADLDKVSGGVELLLVHRADRGDMDSRDDEWSDGDDRTLLGDKKESSCCCFIPPLRWLLLVLLLFTIIMEMLRRGAAAPPP